MTDRDIVIRRVAVGSDPKTQRMSEAMSADPVTIGPDDDVTAAQKATVKRLRHVRLDGLAI